MHQLYHYQEYPYQRSPDQDADGVSRHPIVIVGAGPVGLCAALDLADQGEKVVVLDDDNKVSVGSRAVCYAKRSLEILDRLQVGDRCVNKGVSWQLGRVFFGDAQIYQFDLLPEQGHERPAFINLQQYYLEEALLERCLAHPNISVRWQNKLTGLQANDASVFLTIDTPEEPYSLLADWLIACDGAHSTVREALGEASSGWIFKDRFLIIDIVMNADFPAERWFWFDPPFHRNQSTLLHRQPDGLWRIDFQLGWDADPEFEKQPEQIDKRVRAMLGADLEYQLEWASVYTFACRRMKQFRHNRILFAGDAAHQVSPFGARGFNSGIQDTDNLSWKLARVRSGKSPARLLDSYDEERTYAADVNIQNSTRSTDFITPKSPLSRMVRDAVLQFAKNHVGIRALINSGRLSVPAQLAHSSLNYADDKRFSAGVAPGSPAEDAPIACPTQASDWLLRHLSAKQFVLLLFAPPGVIDTHALPADITPLYVLPNASLDGQQISTSDVLFDVDGKVYSRYQAVTGSAYLFRPDQHVCARWYQDVNVTEVRRAFDQACGLTDPPSTAH